MKYFIDDIIDGNSLSLDEYLEILLHGNFLKLFPNNCFPSNEMLDEYLSMVKDIPEKEVKKLIYRYLVQEGSYGTDDIHRQNFMKNKEYLREINKEFPIYSKRVILNRNTWEGITWVIDLLPHYPKDAIDVIDSFYKIYCQALPDSVIFGLSSVNEIIRAKYFEVENKKNALENFDPYEFEILIAELFSEMGYKTELTKKNT